MHKILRASALLQCMRACIIFEQCDTDHIWSYKNTDRSYKKRHRDRDAHRKERGNAINKGANKHIIF